MSGTSSRQRAAGAAAPSAARAVHEACSAGYERAQAAVGETVATRSIAGVSICARVAGDGLADRLLPALAGAETPPALRGRTAILRAWDSTGSGVPPPRSPWSPGDFLPRDEIRGSGEDGVDVAYSVAWRTLATWDRQAAIGTYWLPDAAELPSWEPGAPFRWLLHWLLADCGLVLAHAAVVGDGTDGVALVGIGGSGKSTAALACVDAGWAFVGDDYCALDTAGAPTAHALYGIAKLDDPSAALLPGVVARAPMRWRAGPKRVLDVAGAYPGQAVASLRLRAVVVPRVAAATGHPRRLAETAGIRALAPSSLLQLPGARPDALQMLRASMAGLPVWGLDVGPDVERVPAALGEILASTIPAGSGRDGGSGDRRRP